MYGTTRGTENENCHVEPLVFVQNGTSPPTSNSIPDPRSPVKRSPSYHTRFHVHTRLRVPPKRTLRSITSPRSLPDRFTTTLTGNHRPSGPKLRTDTETPHTGTRQRIERLGVPRVNISHIIFLVDERFHTISNPHYWVSSVIPVDKNQFEH